MEVGLVLSWKGTSSMKMYDEGRNSRLRGLEFGGEIAKRRDSTLCGIEWNQDVSSAIMAMRREGRDISFPVQEEVSKRFFAVMESELNLHCRERCSNHNVSM
jgi:hypothetical protein